jgi:hypothetical protein
MDVEVGGVEVEVPSFHQNFPLLYTVLHSSRHNRIFTSSSHDSHIVCSNVDFFYFLISREGILYEPKTEQSRTEQK